MKLLATLVVATTILTGCASQTYMMNPHADSAALKPAHDKMQTFFVGGIGQEQEVNAAQVCGGANRVVKVETQTTFLNGLLGTLTQGIYTPRQIRVFCQ